MGIYFNEKQEREDKAHKWVKYIEENYQNLVDDSVNNSIIYYAGSVRETTTSSTPSSVKVQDIDVVSAIYDTVIHHPNAKVCVLNFASYKYPGGAFLDGSMAQEEALCHASTLYNSLMQFEKTFYAPHRQKGATNRALYADEAIYLPNVNFFYKNSFILQSDVLTCASPNFKAGSRYMRVTADENAKVMKQRIKFIKAILEEQKVNIAILGAWGCGVFGQDPAQTAQFFQDIFTNTTIPSIVYAIPASNYNNNYTSFKRIIKEI